MNIIGAGLSGLLCGAMNATARIFESNPSSLVSHRAILRFREDKIARTLGLSFRKVTVRKAIWLDGRELNVATPRLANLYSQKVRGVIAENSLWSLGPLERYIAPDDLHAVLADICGGRVEWDCEVTADRIRHLGDKVPIISTIPIPILLALLGIIREDGSIPDFKYSPILVSRFTIPDCDVFQTLYFPDPTTPVYRATLTGSLLTIESTHPGRAGYNMVIEAFGLGNAGVQEKLIAHKQSFGKINPVSDAPRKALLHHLTINHGIYSLGRFATWRNILLDDVYEDVFAIRKMIYQSQYDVSLERSRT